MNQNKKIIGLTGSIATGKSLVSKHLIDLGYNVIDADKIAKDIVNEKEIIRKIKSNFGDDIYFNNELNRRKLAEIIFKDQNKRKILNSIMFPAIYHVIKEKIENLSGMIFIDIPLLFENKEINKKYDLIFDEIWLVYTDVETQINRLMSRDNISRKYAMNKISSQISVEDKKEMSDIVIDNSGKIEETLKQVDSILGK